MGEISTAAAIVIGIIGAIGGIGGIISLIYWLRTGRWQIRKIKAETIKAENDADLSSIQLLKSELESLKIDYKAQSEEHDRKYNEIKAEVQKLISENKDLKRGIFVVNVAIDNLGVREQIENEIERIKG